MVQIICIGAGGGGAPGRSGPSSGFVWGGSGGASGGITKLTIPAFIIPDIIYVQVGVGGRGGIGVASSNGTIGTKGTDSVVSISATTTSTSVICIAPGGNTPALSTDASSGAGAITSTTYTNTNSPFITSGIYSFESTIIGKKSGTDLSINALSSSVLTGGAAGGSSVTYLGGSVFSASALLLTNLSASPIQDGTSGPNGYGILSPIFCGTGGAGGNGNNSTAGVFGGNGGNGFIGCGGGGGGGATTRGGNGGNGGDGIVFITTIF